MIKLEKFKIWEFYIKTIENENFGGGKLGDDKNDPVGDYKTVTEHAYIIDRCIIMKNKEKEIKIMKEKIETLESNKEKRLIDYLLEK